MKPNRTSLARQFNQIRIDREGLIEFKSSLDQMTQVYHKMLERYNSKRRNYESAQRSWFLATHETKVASPKPSATPIFDQILAKLLSEEISKAKERIES